MPVLPDVAKTGAYGDLLNKPVVPTVGSKCGSGLVLLGFKADGSLEKIAQKYLGRGTGNLPE